MGAKEADLAEMAHRCAEASAPALSYCRPHRVQVHGPSVSPISQALTELSQAQELLKEAREQLQTSEAARRNLRQQVDELQIELQDARGRLQNTGQTAVDQVSRGGGDTASTSVPTSLACHWRCGARFRCPWESAGSLLTVAPSSASRRCSGCRSSSRPKRQRRPRSYARRTSSWPRSGSGRPISSSSWPSSSRCVRGGGEVSPRSPQAFHMPLAAAGVGRAP